jgi:hypothetical protein
VEQLRRPVLCDTTQRGNQGEVEMAAGAGPDLRPAKNAAVP